jgi:chemotaxis protein MotB
MRNRRRLLLGDEVKENFWPSFTDLTSTIALILFVLVLIAYIQNLISGKQLALFKAELDDTARRLETSNLEIGRSEKQLRLLADRLKKTKAEIEAGQLRLKLSEEKVAEQQQIIAESNRELGELRVQLRGIAVLRVSVLNKVKQSIEAQLGPTTASGQPLVRIADNGNIVINENLLFELNSYQIKNSGKPLLNTFATAFENLLSDGQVRRNIDVILVQGHTDERGAVAYNRDLSSRRANTVLNYMFKANPALEKTYGRYFASSAYSEFRPIDTAKSKDAYEQNRRIEISVVLKDIGIQRVIDDYLKKTNPIFQQTSTRRQ